MTVLEELACFWIKNWECLFAMDSSAAVATLVAEAWRASAFLALSRLAIESSCTMYLGSLMIGGDTTTCSRGDATIIRVGCKLSSLGFSNCTLGGCCSVRSVSRCTIVFCTLGSRRSSCRSICILLPGLNCSWICSNACICLLSAGSLIPSIACLRSWYALIMTLCQISFLRE